MAAVVGNEIGMFRRLKLSAIPMAGRADVPSVLRKDPPNERRAQKGAEAMSMESQAALVDRAKRGDVEAFEILARDAARRLHPVALHLLRDPDLADDAVQQTLVTIWHQLGQLRDADRFDGWSYRLLVRFCMRELRARKRFAGGVEERDVPSRAADAAAEIADRDQLERALRHLSVDHRAVVGLVYYGGLSGPEAAEMLGVSPGTVASRLHYALRGMRAALEADSRPTLAAA